MIRKRTMVSAPLLAVALVLATAASAPASVIVAFGGASGPGLESMSFNNLGTPVPGNDNVVGVSPNWLSVNQKAFNSVDYIDMVFIVEDFGVPHTEYIFTEGVHNGTGEEWTDYHIELGFGIGPDFVLSPAGDGLDFDAPDYDSPFDFNPFTTLTIGEDTIDAVDGTVPDFSFHVFTFTIDVPNTITEFTIRQYPTIEPVAAEGETWSAVKSLFR